MKVAVVGGTGFVGSYLVDELGAQNHEPVLLVRPGSEGRISRPDHCAVVTGDVGQESALRATLARDPTGPSRVSDLALHRRP